MLFTAVSFAALLIFQGVSGSPLAKRLRKPSQTDVFQYALTLEHLENAFYTEALQKFDEKAFENAGFQPIVRKRFQQIADHEKTHVEFITAVLGKKATKPCTYNFPYTDVKSFTALSQMLEGVGVSAYAGAAQFIKDDALLTAAATVLSTEARHASWIASSVNGDTPWSGPLDTPLTLSQVFSLAAAFIESCPKSNPTLPVKQFPSLSISPAKPSPGDEITLSYDTSKGKNVQLAFFAGLSVVSVDIKDGKATLPKDLVGTVYAVVTTDGKKPTDDNIVAGPAILEFPDDS
ncbi:hypothetical protein FRB99_008631 [Tulasnella sp. 403]|nr:hypothetical protein FRB99_008631 [Tulasnella sp. 403]